VVFSRQRRTVHLRNRVHHCRRTHRTREPARSRRRPSGTSSRHDQANHERDRSAERQRHLQRRRHNHRWHQGRGDGPKNDKEWAAVGDSAAAIVESGNLLLVGDRFIDQREWLSYTQRFIAAGKAALAAANEKKPDGILAAGGDLDETCDACHEKYQRQ
jgi:hypothetical protein